MRTRVVLANLLHGEVFRLIEPMERDVILLRVLVDVDRVDRRFRSVEHIALEPAEIDEDGRDE